jgi:hypothetical protein
MYIFYVPKAINLYTQKFDKKMIDWEKQLLVSK